MNEASATATSMLSRATPIELKAKETAGVSSVGSAVVLQYDREMPGGSGLADSTGSNRFRL